MLPQAPLGPLEVFNGHAWRSVQIKIYLRTFYSLSSPTVFSIPPSEQEKLPKPTQPPPASRLPSALSSRAAPQSPATSGFPALKPPPAARPCLSPGNRRTAHGNGNARGPAAGEGCRETGVGSVWTVKPLGPGRFCAGWPGPAGPARLGCSPAPRSSSVGVWGELR